MARVKGVKEKVHSPLYDAFVVKGGPEDERQTFEQAMGADTRLIRFFVNVQGKTKLETNLQAAGVLPSQNTFEAWSMRVVASPLARERPLNTEQFLTGLMYNTVTSLLVGEKVMIEMPTFWFPSGSGLSSGNGRYPSIGEANPLATFRFAEPVIIEPKQNFRVEMMFPNDAEVNGVPNFRGAEGPIHVWVVLDGYLTRDVQ